MMSIEEFRNLSQGIDPDVVKLAYHILRYAEDSFSFPVQLVVVCDSGYSGVYSDFDEAVAKFKSIDVNLHPQIYLATDIGTGCTIIRTNNAPKAG